MGILNSLHSIQFILYTTLLLFKRGTGLFKFESIVNLKYGLKIMFSFAQGSNFSNNSFSLFSLELLIPQKGKHKNSIFFSGPNEGRSLSELCFFRRKCLMCLLIKLHEKPLLIRIFLMTLISCLKIPQEELILNALLSNP